MARRRVIPEAHLTIEQERIMRKLIYTGCLGLLMLGSIGMSAQVVVAQEESQLTEEQQLRESCES